MMGNIFDFLPTFKSWLSVEPSHLRVPPGRTAEAVVTLDGTEVNAGENIGDITLNHNVPGKGALVIPISFTVGGRLALELSTNALDFGSVLVGNSSVRNCLLSNEGNLPAKVSVLSAGNPAFKLNTVFPITLAPGDQVLLEVVFTPIVSSSAPANLVFSTEGLVPLSVALTGIGLRPAALEVSSVPAPLNFTVPLGGFASGILGLSNTGDENLNYVLKLHTVADSTSKKPVLASSSYGLEYFKPMAKGAYDIRVGHPVDQDFGGPDQFGYRWIDSRDVDGPIYNWIDISRTGTRLNIVSACDDCSENIGLSFSFPFYQINSQSVFVSSNGYLTLDSGSGAFSNHPLPAKEMPRNLIAAQFQDLYPAGGGSIFFQDFGDKAVVQYQDVPDFNGTGTYDFEIILSANGTIDLQYKRLSGVRNTATIGIQNGLTDDGLLVAYNSNFLVENLAIRLRTWLAIPQQVGGIMGGVSKSLPLSLDSRGLQSGTYMGKLEVSGGGSISKNHIEVPVKLIVNPTRAKIVTTP
jgi:hypothetical protein